MGAPKGHRPETLVKIHKAIKLRESGLPYSKIARKVGYADSGSLYTMLKRHLESQGRDMSELALYQDS